MHRYAPQLHECDAACRLSVPGRPTSDKRSAETNRSGHAVTKTVRPRQNLPCCVLTATLERLDTSAGWFLLGRQLALLGATSRGCTRCESRPDTARPRAAVPPERCSRAGLRRSGRDWGRCAARSRDDARGHVPTQRHHTPTATAALSPGGLPAPYACMGERAQRVCRVVASRLRQACRWALSIDRRPGLVYRRRNVALSAGVPKLQLLSATLIVTPGGTIWSMRSSRSLGRSIPSAAR